MNLPDNMGGIFLAGVVVFTILVVLGMHYYYKAKYLKRKRWAESKGYEFRSTPKESAIFSMGTDIHELCDDMRVNGIYPFVHGSQHAKNLVVGECDGVSFMFFDYHYRINQRFGSHRTSTAEDRTVVIFHSPISLPVFEVFPKTLLNRITSVFNKAPVNFDFPEIKRSVHVNTPEPEHVLPLLTRDILYAMAYSRFDQWAGVGSHLIVSQPGRRKEKEIDLMIESGPVILKMILEQHAQNEGATVGAAKDTDSALS